MKSVKIATYVFIALLVLLQYPLWFGDGGVFAMWRLQREITAQQKENQQLRERNQALEAQVNDLKQGLEVIEGRARSELGMVKKGEAFYQVIDPKPADKLPEKSQPVKK
jgi:cell division protein FtsB